MQHVQVTLLTRSEGPCRKRDEDRQEILSEAFSRGGSVTDTARRLEVATSLIYELSQQRHAMVIDRSFAPALVAEEAARRP